MVSLAAKATGLKALEFALSICDTVDMYGFPVDPGQDISQSRPGHTPLQGRAYYQMMECLGVNASSSILCILPDAGELEQGLGILWVHAPS
ncbi:hypothetical protein F0562_023217 [Nyssa sinensis]|uniref:Uncharacterized protein n=1 Tax=Nyssa sinensis TaxID=561372 RepID=A0A5J5BG51_9ASTE|nr:hypothetical protein F0562_023217 [Nyssa sinensis]